MQKIRYALSPLFFLFVFCQSNDAAITEVFRLPKKISEASAVEVTQKSSLIWTLEDSGNKPELYALDAHGAISRTVSISNAVNHDWEDLASDGDGNLYIGDFGNNGNDRKDLGIYRINAADLAKGEAAVAQTISFYYPEQTEFPPKKPGRFFDAESFFFANDNFYIVTKNRSSHFDGTTNLYRVPNRPGNHAAALIGSFKACGDFNHCAITSADISPDGSKVALLSASCVWVFEKFQGDAFFSGQATEIDLRHYSQKEGVCFKSNSQLYITDERDKKSGGCLYQLDLR